MQEFLNRVIHGDCLEELKKLPDNSIDSVVTDPPYGLSKEPNIYEVLTKWMNGEDYHHRGGGFMGKSWDSFVPGPSIWKEVYRVLKPGGHLLCFAGTRTQDLMTISLRLAGFEIRDVIEWIYFNGFPKSVDIGKALNKRGKKDLSSKWDGWGSGLKPSHEPIILCRKPIEKSIIDNVERWETGGLNIDGCRIEGDSWGTRPDSPKTNNVYGHYNPIVSVAHEKGRFPTNCVTLEENEFFSEYFRVTPKELSKKASPKDRNSDWQGNEINLPPKQGGSLKGTFDKSLKTGSGKERKAFYKNNHPTVKPVPLMEWLVRLITPPNGVVLDPFAGSGSTLVAAKREGFNYIGIEKEAEYVEIAKLRVGQR